MVISSKISRGWVLNASLHLGKKRLEHLPSWSIKQVSSLVDVFFINPCSQQELSCFVSEHIAVMVDEVVFFRLETRTNILQKIFKDVFWKLSLTKCDFLNWFAVWCLLRQIIAYSTAKIVLPTIDDDRGMIDCVDLLPNNHHAHAASHSHCDIVNKQGYFLCHELLQDQNDGIQLIVRGRSYRMSKPGLSKNVMEVKKRNNEIINNLKQTLGKPTIVEAQRTLKILQKLIDRIAIFLNLDSDFVIKFNEINNAQKLKLNKALLQELSPPLLDLLVKQAKLQLEFRTHATVEQQERDGQIIEEQKKQQYLRIKKDMEYNFRSLIRSLEAKPSDLEILKSLKSNSTPNVEGSSIYESLSNYKIIMQKMLATAAEEEDSHAQMIKQLETKIDSLEKTKSNCEGDLLKLRQERAKHTQDKKQEIDKLKSQIREIKNYKDKQIQKINKQNKQLHDGLAKDHKARQDKLKIEISTERTKLQKLRDQNLKLQNKSKTQKSTNEAQLIDLINTYDKQMFAFTNSKSDAQKQLKRVSDQLNNLRRHFTEIEQERKRQEAIIQADRQRRERWQLMERRKAEAATRIKQAYRLYKLKSKKKKKKKGK